MAIRDDRGFNPLHPPETKGCWFLISPSIAIGNILEKSPLQRLSQSILISATA
jgi:hypothetical protein